uniref:Plexin_cytopl domain-containing protein n=1 Tax=Haemonchus placei TaxID=6290 RepID=A0A0N4VZP6_HAEPC
LRFWVNLIKNPHFVFDIQKPTKVEGCLSVVAQTLMDACSTQDHQLTKDSPSSKLLFAKDMYQYRDWVDSYYSDIARLPPISDQDMASLLNEESRIHRGQFHVFSALNELYKYLDQYKDPIMDALEHNEHAQASRLPGRLQVGSSSVNLLNTGVAEDIKDFTLLVFSRMAYQARTPCL